ncbi:MAG: NADPH:quinone oxidoreductase family protein [Acetobacteraceae bacterium]
MHHSAATMRAMICTGWGEPDRLSLAEVPSPPLRAGSLRVAVAAAAVNFADLLMIAGRYQENPPLPFSPGFEVAGIVREVAPDVAGWRAGDRVMGMLPHGGYASEAIVPADQAFRVPPSLDPVAAAGVPVAFGTAYGALVWRARLRPGETLLVFGAAGGVGLAATALGRLLGARVIAVASGAERLAVAAEHGAEHLIDHRGEDVAARVRDITAGRGADVILDPVGGGAFDSGLRCIASEGRLVVVGFASGEVGQISAGVALGRNIDLIGCYWGAYRGADPARVRGAYEEIARWIEAGRLRPHVGARFPLAEAASALAALRQRRVAGKIVLVM